MRRPTSHTASARPMRRHVAGSSALLVAAAVLGCAGLPRRGEPLCRAAGAAAARLAPEPVVLAGVRVWAPLAYSGPARDLVRALKFRGAARPRGRDGGADRRERSARTRSSRTLAAGARAGPAAPAAAPARGFNQAAAIAAALARRAGLAVVDCLVRSGRAVTQVGRDRAERRAGPAGSITRRAPRRSGSLLVDDVVTTGATLGACGPRCARAGAREVPRSYSRARLAVRLDRRDRIIVTPTSRRADAHPAEGSRRRKRGR